MMEPEFEKKNNKKARKHSTGKKFSRNGDGTETTHGRRNSNRPGSGTIGTQGKRGDKN